MIESRQRTRCLVENFPTMRQNEDTFTACYGLIDQSSRDHSLATPSGQHEQCPSSLIESLDRFDLITAKHFASLRCRQKLPLSASTIAGGVFT
jgi:hypothetical protein